VTKIRFVSSNRSKAKVFTASVHAAGFEVERVDLPLVEPQASTVEAVARAKAEQAFAQIGGPLAVEDSGFSVDALSGFPGPSTKYVLETVGVSGLLRLAHGLPSRTCRFVGALVYVDADGATHAFLDDRGVGTLALEADLTPCEEAWSALWSVFIPEGASRPIAALSPAEREAVWARWHAHSVYARFARWLASKRGSTP
jgi:non-canonical purine NTP pyrophosphatase (RdgB/HAM1 family)